VIIYGQPVYVAELFPCTSCEEIKKLDPSARSGLYVIKASDGQSLQQASRL